MLSEQTTGNVQAIYNTIFAGARATVEGLTQGEFNSLRTSLCRLNRTPRFLLEATDLSVCATFDSAKGTAIFWLGDPRKAARKYSFIVQETAACDATK